jgi:Flp pilus assembly protein TadG
MNRPNRRRGSVTLELLLNLPIWLLALFGTIEFGQILSNMQHVSLASRVGAEEAAQTASLPPSGDVPDNVLAAIERQLGAVGIAPAKVILEHNSGGTAVALVSGTGRGDPPDTPLPTLGTYVRVTVFARMGQLGPRLLDQFGVDVGSRVLGESTTFYYQANSAEAP